MFDKVQWGNPRGADVSLIVTAYPSRAVPATKKLRVGSILADPIFREFGFRSLLYLYEQLLMMIRSVSDHVNSTVDHLTRRAHPPTVINRSNRLFSHGFAWAKVALYPRRDLAGLDAPLVEEGNEIRW